MITRPFRYARLWLVVCFATASDEIENRRYEEVRRTAQGSAR